MIHIVMKFSPIGAFGVWLYDREIRIRQLRYWGNCCLLIISLLSFIFAVLNLIGRYYGFDI